MEAALFCISKERTAQDSRNVMIASSERLSYNPAASYAVTWHSGRATSTFLVSSVSQPGPTKPPFERSSFYENLPPVFATPVGLVVFCNVRLPVLLPANLTCQRTCTFPKD